MHPQDYLQLFVRSYNPNQYEGLMQTRFRDLLAFLGITLAIGMLLFTLLFLPVSYQYINRLPVTLDQVERFEVSGVVEAPHPVVLLEEPSIVLDVGGNSTDARDHDFILTGTGITYPKYFFFGDEFVEWADLRNLKNPTPTRDRLLAGIVIFLLPSIIFWFLAYSVVLISFIFLFLVLIGYFAPRPFKHRIELAEVLKVAVLSMPSVIIIGIGLYPLAPGLLFWWGFGLTIAIFAVGVFLISERRTDMREHRRSRQ